MRIRTPAGLLFLHPQDLFWDICRKYHMNYTNWFLILIYELFYSYGSNFIIAIIRIICIIYTIISWISRQLFKVMHVLTINFIIEILSSDRHWKYCCCKPLFDSIWQTLAVIVMLMKNTWMNLVLLSIIRIIRIMSIILSGKCPSSDIAAARTSPTQRSFALHNYLVLSHSK